MSPNPAAFEVFVRLGGDPRDYGPEWPEELIELCRRARVDEVADPDAWYPEGPAFVARAALRYLDALGTGQAVRWQELRGFVHLANVQYPRDPRIP